MEEDEQPDNISIRLFSEADTELSQAPIVLPLSTTVAQLESLCNQLLDSSDDPVPISFRTRNGLHLQTDIEELAKTIVISSEKSLDLIFSPEAVFRVQPVTRCSSSLPGHDEPVISVQFSPDGRGLASGSGDTTVRFWDLNTELPLFTCKGHDSWVLCIAWSPNAKKLASACKKGNICIWNTEDGSQLGKTLTGHKQWITQLTWQPFHKDPSSRYLASAGKDGILKIWDTIKGTVLRNLSGHTASITCVRWGGDGLLYSGSQDRTVKVWRAEDGVLCRSLTGHAHWINTIALDTDYVLRTSCFDPKNNCAIPSSDEDAVKVALSRYEQVKSVNGERLVSGSDDFTMYLWEPGVSKKPIARMTGHQQLVNQVWSIRTRKISIDLPGHGDEVFAVDWSPEGERVASGGKDKLLRIWRR